MTPALVLLALLGGAPERRAAAQRAAERRVAERRAAEPLVPVSDAIPSAVVELKYATTDNFMRKAVYPADARCLMLARTLQRLAVAARTLEVKGYRLKLYDCYRPHSAQAELWKSQPRPGYVMDPKKGSNHSRGTAVDLTLVRSDGGAVQMPSAYDFFGRAAHHRFQGGTAEARANRDTLREAMVVAGFKPNPLEWWHYELPDAWRAPVRDEPVNAP